MMPPKDWPPIPVDLDAVIAVLQRIEVSVALGERVSLPERFCLDLGEALEQLRVRSAAVDVYAEALTMALGKAKRLEIDAKILILQQVYRDLWSRVKS